jgi:hypothetical protein
MPNYNRTIGERPEARRLRASMDAEQMSRRREEKSIVDAHRNASGPSFSASTESQTPPQKPRISKPGSAS